MWDILQVVTIVGGGAILVGYVIVRLFIWSLRIALKVADRI